MASSEFQRKAKAVGRDSLLWLFNQKEPTGDHPPGSNGNQSTFERRLLGNLLNRTVHVFSQHTYKHPDEERLSSATHEGAVRIVCVSSSLEIALERDLEPAEYRDGCTMLRRARKFAQERWLAARKQELRSAIAKEPHVICFPEFAYPPPPSADAGGGWTIPAINEAVKGRLDFDAAALKELGSKDTFVFLGSYHCPMTLYNVGIVYPWGNKPGGKVRYTQVKREKREFGGFNTETENHENDVMGPVIYRKRFPARKLGEQTRVPTGSEFNIFNRSFARMALIICSDALDLNQFMTLVRSGVQRDEGVEFILLPNYSRLGQGTFRRLCKDLSYLTATAVIAAGAADPDAEMTPTDIFLCGEAVSDIDDNSPDYMHGVVSREPFEASKVSDGVCFDVNMTAFRRAREAHLRVLQKNDTDIQSRPI